MPRSLSSMSALAAKMLRFVLVVLLFMAMAGIGAYLTLTLIIKGEDSVVVPDLVGKDVLTVLEVLSDLGLNTRVRETAYNDRIAKNHIIDQDPAPGAAIKRGRDVKIRVSRGPETIIMPNLTGLSLQQSRILLTENGLCQGALAGMTSARNAVDQVMAQYPPPGEAVSRHTCSDLLVSRGPESSFFAMTDLSGYTLEAAIRRLEQLQLTVGRITVVHKPGTPPETIVDQLPLAGYRVSMGSRVNLTVNGSAAGKPATDLLNADRVALFRFPLENGFLKKRVQVKLNQARMSLTLFDDFLSPGQEIWLSVPKSGNPTVLVYVDGQLVESRMMNGS